MSYLIEKTDSAIKRSRAFCHPFLATMRSAYHSRTSMNRFAIQWFKAATAHKQAFPGLIYNSDNDEIRLNLIDILDEEYGFGEAGAIHSRILARFLTALDISMDEAREADAVAGVKEFSRRVDEYWLSAPPKVAFGVHYALEFLAANMHKAFFAGVSRLGLPDDAIHYFKLHSAVEDEHAEKAGAGLLMLASEGEEARAELEDGIRRGTELVETLLDGLNEAYQGSALEKVH